MSLVKIPPCQTAADVRSLALANDARWKEAFRRHTTPAEPEPIIEPDPVFLPIDLYLSMPWTCPTISSGKIIRFVCEYFQFTREELFGKRRDYPVVDARHIAMYLIKKHRNFSLPEIGRRLNRDHTTVLAGIRRVEKYLTMEGNVFREAIPEIELRLGI
jgi:hypothetical protein